MCGFNEETIRWLFHCLYCTYVDVDECLDPCHCKKHGACVNTIGSYTCGCRDGFQRIGHTCQRTFCCLASFIRCFHLCGPSRALIQALSDHRIHRAFQVAGPRLWNSLSASRRQCDTTVGQFKKLLKTPLFSWDCGALVTVAFTAPCINISTARHTCKTIPAPL